MPGGMHLPGCTSSCGGAPPPAPLSSTRPPPRAPNAPSRLPLGARGALALALGPPSGPHASVPLPVPWVPPPVTHALACLLAHRPSLRSMHLGALPAPLRALPVPWPLPGSLPCVAPSAARALSPSAAAGLGAPSVFAPLLLAACALARSLRVPLGTSPVASCPPLRAPMAGTQLCLRAVPSFLDHAPGVPLPLQLRQRDAWRRALGRRGADVPRPPRGEGLGGERLWGGWCGCGWGWRGRGTSRPPCPLLLLRRPPARHPWPVRGPSPTSVACWGPRRGRPRPWRGPPGPRSQPLAHPPRSTLRLRQPSAMRPVPAPGLPPVPAACRGPRSGPRRGSLGLRSPLPARLGPPPGAGRQGLLLGRRGRSPRPAQARGSTARCQRRPPGAYQPAARPAPPPPPATAPRAPRGSPPPLSGRWGSGSGTGGGGGRPAGGSHRSLTSLLYW